MFEATLSQAVVFKKVIEAIKDLITDANFDCSPGGISLQGMDAAHIALVELQLRSSGFEPYRCDQALALGLKLEWLSKVLKLAGSKDSLTLTAEDEPDNVSLRMESETKDNVKQFEVKLMDISADRLQIPSTDYECVVKMPAGEFMKICKDLSQLGDTMVIEVEKQQIKFTVQGECSGSITRTPTECADDDDDEELVIDMTEPVSQKFNLQFLNYITKATPLASSVQLSMAQNAPLVVEYQMEEERGYLRFFLAPKIEDEDEDED